MNSKKRILLIILVLALLIGCASILYSRLGANLDTMQLAVSSAPVENETVESTGESKEPESEKTKAPDFTVLDIEGNEVRFYDYLGKPVVLNFWASWCGPCQMEMPDFEEAYKAHGDEVNFLIVNMTDGSRETVDSAKKFVQDKGYTFPVYFDTQQEAAYGYMVYYLPTTYFIDAEGYILASASGALDAENLQKGLDMILS